MELPEEPFTTRQAAALGVSRQALHRLRARGVIRQVLHGVHARSTIEDTIELRAGALGLVLGDHHVVVDRTAAWLHGVDHYRLGELACRPPIDVVSLPGFARPRRRGVFGGERDLAPDDVQVIDGTRVTTPARTAADLACLFGRRDALSVLNLFMHDVGVTRSDLVSLLPRFVGRRGVVQLRELVTLATPQVESAGESWTFLVIHDAGLPAPVPQFWIVVDGVKLYRLDLAWPHLRIAVEYDGDEFHGPEQRAADEARREWLRRHGWIVIVVRKDGFSGAALDAWLGRLRKAIQERTPVSKRRYARAGS